MNESDPNREIGFGSVAFARGRAAIAPRAARGEARRSCARDPGLVRPHPLSKWSPPPGAGRAPRVVAGCLSPTPAGLSRPFLGLSQSNFEKSNFENQTLKNQTLKIKL